MHVLHLKYHIVFKGFLLILFACFCLGNLLNKAHAATPPSIDGMQLMQALQSKQLSLSQASTLLSQQGNLPLGQASQLLQKLQGGNIGISDAANLLNGALGGQGTVNTENIGNILQMVQGLQSGNASPQAISGLLGDVASGLLPPEIGKALGAVGNLGDIASISTIQDIFKNPAVTGALKNVLQQTGAPDFVTDMISNIGSLATDPLALQGAGRDLVAQAITQALQQVVPELVKALGGSEALQEMLKELLGGTKKGNEVKLEEIKDNGGVECGAQCPSCQNCAPKINQNHRTIRAHVSSEFRAHRNWLVTTYFMKYILPSMMQMTEAFSTNMMQQVQIIGTFFDAKHQLETQRLFQTMVAQAHKDYHPSESMCTIGTNVRSLAASERRSDLTQVAFANRMMERQLLNGDGLSTYGDISDRKSRLDLFIRKFCDKTDHGTALDKLCKNGGKNEKQVNIDVDYTSAFENKLTLDVNFTNDGNGPATDDEENLFALSANLFANQILPGIAQRTLVSPSKDIHAGVDWYMDLRSIAAKRSVAQNSFAAITALKTEGDAESAPFLKAILKESGISPKDIEDRLGENPSYFAQMEVLTKDLYQNPTFYANLYDKPVNIERKAAALQAIELMHDRDMYKSLLRSEAVLATLIETLLSKEHDRVSDDLANLSSDSEKITKESGP